MKPAVAVSADAVVSEAARLFAERGYANTRMHDIAERFGVTHAALYYHFRNKEEVLQRINEVAIEGLLSMAREVSETGPPGRRFESALQRHIEFVAGNLLVVGTLFDEEKELSPAFSERLREQRRSYTAQLVELFVEGQQAGWYDPELDPKQTVSLLIGAGSWTYRWYRPERDGDPAEFAEHAAGLLARSFRLKRRRTAAAGTAGKSRAGSGGA